MREREKERGMEREKERERYISWPHDPRLDSAISQ